MGRILLLICALVVAVGLGASAKQPPQTQGYPAQQDAPASQSAPVRAPETEPDRHAGGNQSQTDDKPSPLEQSDLAAQWTMAGFAGLQLILTFLGLLYIRWTLIETKKAVKEAGDATAAAENAIEVTRLSAERQLRAYLSIDKISATGLSPGETPVVWISVTNRGQTPARNLWVKTVVVRCTGLDPDEAPIRGMAGKLLYDLGPGQRSSQSVDIMKAPLSGEQYLSLGSGAASFVVAGYIRYTDMFGRTRRNIFRANLTKASLTPAGDGHLLMSDRHVRSS